MLWLSHVVMNLQLFVVRHIFVVLLISLRLLVDYGVLVGQKTMEINFNFPRPSYSTFKDLKFGDYYMYENSESEKVFMKVMNSR